MRELTSIDKLDLLANKIVEGYLIGLHRSPFHGYSAEFREHKQYNIGDNLRSIDYKVYARTDKLFIKKYDEETNLRCQLVLDVSNSMYFPLNASRNKLDFSTIAIASLIRLLKKQRDAFGLTLFTDRILQNIEPKLTEKNKQIIYSALYPYINQSQNPSQSNIVECIHQLAYSLKSRSLVVIFTDLMGGDEEDFEEKFMKALQHLIFQKHDLILFHVHQLITESDFEYENTPMEFVDMESNESIKLMPNEFKTQYKEIVSQKLEIVRKKCIQFGVDFVEADIDQDYHHILNNFLRKRAKMK